MNIDEVLQLIESGQTEITSNSLVITDEDMQKIANALSVNKTVTSLSLSFCEISDDGAEILAKALRKNKTLKVLNLSQNKIGNKGVQALAKMLEENTVLEEVNFAWNKFTDKGALALAHALSVNKTLQMMDISANSINDDGEGISGLVAVLKENHTLKKFYLFHFLLFNQHYEAILSLLEANYSLQFYCHTNLMHRNRLLKLQSQNDILRAIDKVANKIHVGGVNALASQASDGNVATNAEVVLEKKYLDLKQQYEALMVIEQDIKNYRTDFFGDENFDLNYLPILALFHLQCIDASLDVSSVADIDSRVLAAEYCLAKLPKESDAYKLTSMRLGDYYFHRASLASVSEAKAFAKTALNYFTACASDRDNGICYKFAKLIEQIKGEDAAFTRETSSMSISDYLSLAKTLKVEGAKMPPASNDRCELFFEKDAEQTFFKTVLEIFDLSLDECLKMVEAERSGLVTSKFFSGVASANQFREAIGFLRQALKEDRVDAYQFLDSVNCLKPVMKSELFDKAIDLLSRKHLIYDQTQRLNHPDFLR